MSRLKNIKLKNVFIMSFVLLAFFAFTGTVYAAYTSRTIYRNQWFTSTSEMSDPVLSTSNSGTTNYTTAAGPGNSVWTGLSTAQDTTQEYSSVADAAKSGSTTLYSVYTFNASFAAGTNVSAVGASSATCKVTTASTSCSVTLPTITPNSGFNKTGWGATTGLTSGDAPGTSKDISTNDTALKGNAWKEYTATFYYNSNATIGSATISSKTASCTTTGNSCSVTIPSEVSSSVGKYNSEYLGLTDQLEVSSVDIEDDTVSINSNKQFYAVYGTKVTVIQPTSTTTAEDVSYKFCGKNDSWYRMEFMDTNSTMTAVLGEYEDNIDSIVNALDYTTDELGYDFYGFATTANTRTRTYNSVEALANSTVKTAYAIFYKSDTAACSNSTFKYSNSATGAVTSTSKAGTAGTGTRYLYPTSTTAATTSYVATTQPTMSAPTSLTGEVTPYGTTAVGWGAVNTMNTSSSYSCGTTYYRIYRSNVTNYYPSSASAATKQDLFRNAYIDSSTATTYAVKLATTNTGQTNFTPTMATGYGTLVGFNTSASQNTATTGLTTVAGLAASDKTTVYQIDKKTESIEATFYYSNSAAGAKASSKASGTRTTFLRPTSTSAAGTSASQETITAPSTTAPTGTTFVGWATSATGMSSATVNTANTSYYAYYRNALTIYYPTGTSSTNITSKNNVIYRNSVYGSTTNYTTVIANGSTSTTQLTNSDITSSVLASMYGTFTGLATSANTTTKYAINNDTIVKGSGTTYYAVNTYTTSVTATFYYSKAAAGTVGSATASGTQTRNVYCSSTSAVATNVNSNGTITAPTLSDEVAPTGTTRLSGWATAHNSMSPGTTYNTGTTKYYAVYRNALTIYYPTGTSSTNITSKNNVIYRNAYLNTNSPTVGTTKYTTVVANGSTSTTQLTNAGITTSVLPSMYGTFGGFATSANTTTKYDVNNAANVVNSSTTTYYVVNTYTTSVTATFYYSKAADGTVGSATASGTQTRNVYCSSTSAVATNVNSNGSITVPSLSGEVAPTGTARLSGWATEHNNMSPGTTYNTGTTNYYAVYRNALTIYYPNTSDGVSNTNTALYRNAYLNTNSPTVNSTKYTTVTATTNTGTTQATSVTLSSLKGTFAGLASAVNSRTRYAVNNAANVVNSTTTTYYAVTTQSITATFYYSNSAAGAKTSTTASADREFYCTSTSAMGTYNNTITPSITETAPYGTTANGWHTAVNSMSTTSVTTANTTYYRNYSKPVTLYYYGTSYTNTTQYRNSYIKAASDTTYTTVLATSNTGLTNYTTAAGPGSSVWTGLSTAQDITPEYTTVAAAATSNNYTFYTVYTFNVAYEKGTKVTSIGATTGSCKVTTNATSCNVTLPSITPDTGYQSVGWNTTSGATTGTAAGSNYSISSNNTKLYANATGKSYTATFYYQSNATNGSTTVTSTTQSCTVSNTDGNCSIDIPSAVRSSVGTYNNSYAGLSSSVGNMTQAVASSTTSLTLTSSPTYYAIYRSNVDIYGPTSESAAGKTTLYRNQWLSSTSAMATTVLSSTTTGTSNASYSSGVSGYTFSGFATTVSTNTASYSSVSAAAASNFTTLYAVLYKTASVTANFYYSNSAAGAKTSKTATGTRTTYLRPTSTSAAGTSVSEGAITAPTLTGEVAPTGTAAVSGFATSASSMSTTTSYTTGTTNYYRVYRNALTVYYPTGTASTNITSKNDKIYRNAYYGSATNYTTVVANGSTGTTQLTNAGVTTSVLPSMLGTFTGLATSTNTTTKYDINNSANVVNNATTTYYAVVTNTENAVIHYNSNTTNGGFTDAAANASTTSTYYCSSTSAVGVNHGTTTTVPSAVSSSVGKYNSAYKGVSSSSTGITNVTTFTGGSTYYAYYSSPLTIYYPNTSNGVSNSKTALYRNEYYSSSTAMTTLTATSQTSTTQATATGTLSNLKGTLQGLATAVNTTTKSAVNSDTIKNSNTTTYYAVTTASENAVIHYNSNTTNGGFTDATANAAVTSTYYCKDTSTMATSHGTTTTVPSAVSSSVGKYNSAYKGVSSSSTGITNETTLTGGQTYYAYYQTPLTIYYYNSSYTNTNAYRNEYYSSGSAMSSVLSTSATGTSNYTTAAGPGSSVWTGLSTGQDTTVEYSTVNAAAGADASALAVTGKLYTVYTFNSTYEKGTNTSEIGGTTGSCKVTTSNTSCNVTLPSITPKTGYTSAGWSTTKDATSGTAAGQSYSLSSNNTKLYGNSTVNTYTIEYKCGTGTGTPPETQTVIYGGSVTIANSAGGCSKTGYTFSNWTSPGANGSGSSNWKGWSTTSWPYVDGQYGITNKKLTLTASYTANTYTIGYTLNGGTKGTNGPTSGTYDSDVRIDNPTKTVTVTGNANSTGATIGSATSKAQTFSGWTSTTVGSNAKTGTAANPSTAWTGTSTKNTYFKNLKESGAVTMVANWTPVSMTLPTVTKTGYTCSWYSTSGTSGGTKLGDSGGTYTPTANSDAAVTAYARCTANSYTIGYTLNGGSHGTNHPTSGTYDSDVRIDNPTKTVTVTGNANSTGATIGSATSKAQTFSGWTSTTVGDNAKTGTAANPSTAWTGTSTKNTYFKNLRESGTVTMVANWTPVSMTLPTVTKTGYTCSWYSTSGTSGGTKLGDSGGTYTPVANSNEEVPAYARCTVNNYTVTANANGGSISSTTGWTGTGASATKSVAYNSEYGTLPTATRSGYTFKGWFSNNTRDISLATSTANYNYTYLLNNAVPGVTYKVKIGSASVIEGSATKFTTYVYDLTDRLTYNGVQSNFDNNVEYDMVVPANLDPSHDIRLIIYSGQAGSTAGIATQYSNVEISTNSNAATYLSSSTVKVPSNHTIYAHWADETAPVCSITSTNNVAASQTATLSCTDGAGVTKYYWGTSSSPSDSDFTTVTSTTSLNTTKTVNAAGTYYLIAKDAAGNTSTVASKTFYKTTLNMTNGTVSPTSVITMSGNSFNLPTPTASANYTTKGSWYTDSGLTNGAKAYGASYTPSANATLYSGSTHNTFAPTITMTIPSEKTIYKVGDTITYNIKVKNTASYAITNVKVSDPNATIGSGTGYTVSSNVATISSLAANAEVTITATKTITESDVNTFNNTATITAATGSNSELSGTPSASKSVNIQSLIKIAKTVNGNMADNNTYFKVKVVINGTSGHKYTISGQDNKVTYNGSSVTPSTTYTVGSDNYIYLKHGQTVTIGTGASDNKIATGTTYKVIEQNTTGVESVYSTYINGSNSNNKDSGNLTTSSQSSINSVAIVNQYGSAVATGVNSKITPYLMFFIISVVTLITAIVYKNVRAKNNDFTDYIE